MATYTLTPDPYSYFADDNGHPLAGGLIYTYTAGTSTPVTTYANSSGTPNSNPVVLDAAGRASIYLQPGLAYKYIVKTSVGALVRSADNITASILAGVTGSNIALCQGRLTLTSGTPVTTADVTAATTLYFTPYQGNGISLYDGAAWAQYSFSELSIPLGTDAANLPFDVFGYISTGTPAIERLAWTSTSSRATGLTIQDGLLMKNGDLTRRFIGTYCTTGTIGHTEDSNMRRLIFNYYNPVPRVLRAVDTTDSWSYATATFRQANASTANQVEIVMGVAERSIRLDLLAFNLTGASNLFGIGIGEDSTTVPTVTAASIGGLSGGTATGTYAMCSLSKYPVVGYHKYCWLERGDGSSTTWYGDDGVTYGVSGLLGTILA